MSAVLSGFWWSVNIFRNVPGIVGFCVLPGYFYAQKSVRFSPFLRLIPEKCVGFCRGLSGYLLPGVAWWDLRVCGDPGQHAHVRQWTVRGAWWTVFSWCYGAIITGVVSDR